MKRTDYHRSQQHKHRLVTLGIMAVLLIAGGLVFNLVLNRHQRQQAFLRNYPVRGVMLDQTDEYADFNQLQTNGMKYVYIRATQGATFTDDDFNDNYTRSIGSGLKVGVYHQYSFSSSIPDQEQNLKRTLGNNIGDLPIMINVSYYNDYNAENVDQKRLKRRLRELVAWTARYSNRPVLIKTSFANYRTLRDLPDTEFMLPRTKTGKNVTFASLTKQDQLYNNGKGSDFRMTAFHGSKVQWNQYLQVLKQNESRKSDLND
ncbi:GH25 family lysozyme [Fructilactobacillus carniphilus]|uniref:Lysozyme n=1 Tax=Fructilactobacillus carniphilus TaxID=2940297 RepID=A0ABY5BWY7_9LACO|nr:GH25 family lysozyme [Fructilactobacillus carniphilus]USS90837.1 hypothetical protein M3M37_01005 [Fructilactobacillus carniphilus]